jgi:ABC-type Na+ efflux pump permease subunit
MVNATHLKVLLKKDYLTLIRNKGFLIAFLMVPVVLMGAFIGIQSLVNKDGEVSGSLIKDHIKYTTSIPFLPDFAPGIGPDKLSPLARKGV